MIPNNGIERDSQKRTMILAVLHAGLRPTVEMVAWIPASALASCVPSKGPTFGALSPTWPRPASRPVPGLTFSV